MTLFLRAQDPLFGIRHHYTLPTLIWRKLNLVYRLSIWIKDAPMFLQFWVFVVLIEHGEYVSLYRFSRPLGSSSLHMSKQICVISPSILNCCSRPTSRRPTSLSHNNFQRTTTSLLQSWVTSIQYRIKYVLVPKLTISHHYSRRCEKSIFKADVLGVANVTKIRIHVQEKRGTSVR